MTPVSTGPQPPRQLPIAFVDCGALWCTCDTTMAEDAIPERCPTCGRATKTLLEEAAVNAKVTAFIESLPLDWGLPKPGESNLAWWSRMTAAREAAASSPASASTPSSTPHTTPTTTRRS